MIDNWEVITIVTSLSLGFGKNMLANHIREKTHDYLALELLKEAWVIVTIGHYLFYVSIIPATAGLFTLAFKGAMQLVTNGL